MPTKTDYSENLELLRQYHNGNEQVLERLVEGNLKLVRSIAGRFSGRGCDTEDLIQIGTMGLLKALKGFDESLGYSFSTYAFPLITGEIKRFLRDDGPIKISRSARANAASVMKARDSLTKEYQREPKLSELCLKTGLSAEEITEALDVSQPLVSIEESINGTDGNLKVGDILTGGDLIEGITDKIALSQAIAQLTPDERRIIYLRYFRNMTQTKVSELLGVSQVTISRAEKKIIDKLRQEIL